MPKKATQTSPSRGIRRPSARTTTFRMRAARPRRSTTIVKGGNSLTAIPVKKNEPPQSMERKISIARSAGTVVR